ncbi:MAG: hypothetical protein HZB53_15305 [Chloroflexi bacterium]|nr:hypothetical protein [Chloroflexota bacterium]
MTKHTNETRWRSLGSRAMRPVRRALAWLCLGALLAAGLSGLLAAQARPAAAQAATTTRVSPARQIVTTGAFSVDVRIDDVVDLYGADFTLTFPPASVAVEDTSLTITSITPGPLLTSGAGGSFVIVNRADNSAGTVRFAVTQFNPSLPVSGSGVLAHINFRVRTTGLIPLTLTAVTLSNRNGVVIPTATENAQVFAGSLPTAVTLESFSAVSAPAQQQPAGFTGLDDKGGAALALAALAVVAIFGRGRRR